MALELIGVARWVTTQLGAISPGVGSRIYEGEAPDKDPATGNAPAYPLIVFNVKRSSAISAMGTERLGVSVDLFWRVIGEGGGYEDIRAIAEAADTALRLTTTQTVTHQGQNYQIHGCESVEPYMDGGYENGIRYNSLGGTNHLVITAS